MSRRKQPGKSVTDTARWPGVDCRSQPLAFLVGPGTASGPTFKVQAPLLILAGLLAFAGAVAAATEDRAARHVSLISKGLVASAT